MGILRGKKKEKDLGEELKERKRVKNLREQKSAEGGEC